MYAVNMTYVCCEYSFVLGLLRLSNSNILGPNEARLHKNRHNIAESLEVLDLGIMSC